MVQPYRTDIFPREVTKCFPLPPLEGEDRLIDLPPRELHQAYLCLSCAVRRAYYHWTEILSERTAYGALPYRPQADDDSAP